MSLFSAFGFGGFDEDPFMSSRNMFGQLDRMMVPMMRDPFGNDPFFHESPLNALMGVPRQPPQRAEMRDPFALMPFGGMNNMMMPAMGNMGREGSCHSFSSSSVVTMTTGPDGRRQVYQASSSSRDAPGGVRETKRTVSDSRTGVRKMAIGHHINDRSHVIEKESKDGELEERQEFINLDEAEAPQFDSEFRHLTQNAYGQGALEHRPRHNRSSPTGHRSTYLPALPSSTSYRRRTRPMLALTSGTRCTEEEEEEKVLSVEEEEEEEEGFLSEEEEEEEDEVIISDDLIPKEVENFERNTPKIKNIVHGKPQKRKAPSKLNFEGQEQSYSDEVICLEEESGTSSRKKRKIFQ